MAKINDDLPNLTLTGDITINGPMFDIHDNEKVEIRVEGQRMHEQEEYDFINLEFFDPDIFNTSERQNHLRHVLQEAMKRMDMESGMDSIAIFIAYIYYKGKELNIKKYKSLFTDIEGLIPGSLPKVIENETGEAISDISGIQNRWQQKPRNGLSVTSAYRHRKNGYQRLISIRWRMIGGNGYKV